VVGIRGRDPRLRRRLGRALASGSVLWPWRILVLLTPVLRLLGRQLLGHGQSRCDALLALRRRALPGGGLTPAQAPGVGLEFGPQSGDLGRCLGATALERRLPAERRSAGGGSHPHAILGHPLERGVTGLQHRREAVDQQTPQHGAVCNPELRQRGGVHAHPAAQPLEADVLAAQPVQLARAPHPLDRGVEPKRQQKARVGRRMTGMTLDRFDRAIQRREIEPLGKGPDKARPVVRRQQIVQADRP
jgi:hypothetical protein